MFIIEFFMFALILFYDLIDLLAIAFVKFIAKFDKRLDTSWIDDLHILYIMRLAYD